MVYQQEGIRYTNGRENVDKQICRMLFHIESTMQQILFLFVCIFFCLSRTIIAQMIDLSFRSICVIIWKTFLGFTRLAYLTFNFLDVTIFIRYCQLEKNNQIRCCNAIIRNGVGVGGVFILTEHTNRRIQARLLYHRVHWNFEMVFIFNKYSRT